MGKEGYCIGSFHYLLTSYPLFLQFDLSDCLFENITKIFISFGLWHRRSHIHPSTGYLRICEAYLHPSIHPSPPSPPSPTSTLNHLHHLSHHLSSSPHTIFTMGFFPNRNRKSAVSGQEAGVISPSVQTTDKSSDRTLTPGHENLDHVPATGVDIKQATKARRIAIYISSFLYVLSVIFLLLVRFSSGSFTFLIQWDMIWYDMPWHDMT